MPRVMRRLVSLPRTIGVFSLLRHEILRDENRLPPFFRRAQIRTITCAVGGIDTVAGTEPCTQYLREDAVLRTC
jgi:hypothetical protein